MNVTDSYRWIILGLMALCQLAYAITFQSIPPILGILVITLSISYAQAGGLTPFEQVSRISLGILVPIAILVWLLFLVWLLVERARLDRHGPTLRDGLRSNIYR